MTNTIAFTDLDFKTGVEKELLLSGDSGITKTSVESVGNELPLTKVEEYFGTTGEYRAFVYTKTDEGINLIERVDEMFGINIQNTLKSDVIGIETNNNVITTIPTQSAYIELEGDLPIGFCFFAVKFFMNNETVAIKVYRLMETLTHNYPELPEGSEIMWWADYHDFAGYDYEQEFDDYLDIFFLNDDHQTVCDYYGKELPSSLYTGYGIRFDKNTQELKKVKSYTYDEDSTIDWGMSVEKLRLEQHNVTLN